MWKIKEKDKKILRELAKRKLEIAHDPVMEERRRLWKKHNSLKGERPMVLLESGGLEEEFLPYSVLQCEEDWARGMEYALRAEILHYEVVKDDSVVDPYLRINWFVEIGDYGVPVTFQREANIEGRALGYRWEPPIKDLERDMEKLRLRSFRVKKEETLKWKEFLEEVFDGILPVKIRGAFWWSLGFTSTAIYLLGLDKFMLYMYDNPEALHRLMKFLQEDQINLAKGLEREGVLSLNNDNDYIGSGGRGFTDELPQPDWKEGDPVRLKDLWGLLESQETVCISPKMFEEFVISYYIPISELLGLLYYGCCEPVHDRWEHIKNLKNLRSVSISPWCNQEMMAEALGRNYIFSRKPPPSLLSKDTFDEEEIRQDVRKTLSLAKKYDLEVEIIMKDLHTVRHQLNRITRWVEIVREEIARFYG